MVLISEMVESIINRTRFDGQIAIVLGSGLGSFADTMSDKTVIPYQTIPNYPLPTVLGHAGEFVFGNLDSVDILAAKGRFHFYEGHDFQTVTLPIRLFQKLGITHLIITNAAGSMNRSFPPGTLMAATGHLDCTFRKSADVPKLYSGNPYHDESLIQLAKNAGKYTGVKIEEGVYSWALGPSYETPEEIDYFKSLGGDAVGMSTVPEILAAGELGIKTLTISCMTNFAAGITELPLTHEEVMETADRVHDDFTRLIKKIIIDIGKTVS